MELVYTFRILALSSSAQGKYLTSLVLLIEILAKARHGSVGWHGSGGRRHWQVDLSNDRRVKIVHLINLEKSIPHRI